MMASEQVDLAWRLSISGASDVKQKISELHEQFNKGEISVEDYAKGLNKAGSTARALGSQSQLNTRIFLAQHPTINQLSRTMAGFNRVLNATLAAQNAINIASLLLRTNTGNMVELQNQLAAAERDYNTAIDPDKKEEAARNVAKYKAEIEDANKQMTEDNINKFFTTATAIATIGTQALMATPALAGFGFALLPVMGALAGIGGVWYLLNNDSDDFVKQMKELSGIDLSAQKDDIQAIFDFLAGPLIRNKSKKDNDPWGWLISPLPGVRNAIEDFTTKWLPDSLNGMNDWIKGTWGIDLKAGMISIWNGILRVNEMSINGILTGAEAMANGFVAAINRLIEAWNSIPNNPFRIGTLSQVSIPRISIPLVTAAAGMDEVVREPRLLLVGEGGQPEHVKVTPGGRGGSGGSSGSTITNNFHYHIAGSIYAERDLQSLADRNIQQQYKRRGYKK